MFLNELEFLFSPLKNLSMMRYRFDGFFTYPWNSQQLLLFSFKHFFNSTQIRNQLA